MNAGFKLMAWNGLPLLLVNCTLVSTFGFVTLFTISNVLHQVSEGEAVGANTTS